MSPRLNKALGRMIVVDYDRRRMIKDHITLSWLLIANRRNIKLDCSQVDWRCIYCEVSMTKNRKIKCSEPSLGLNFKLNKSRLQITEIALMILATYTFKFRIKVLKKYNRIKNLVLFLKSLENKSEIVHKTCVASH